MLQGYCGKPQQLQQAQQNKTKVAVETATRGTMPVKRKSQHRNIDKRAVPIKNMYKTAAGQAGSKDPKNGLRLKPVKP
jgi:hypothetical protein